MGSEFFPFIFEVELDSYSAVSDNGGAIYLAVLNVHGHKCVIGLIMQYHAFGQIKELYAQTDDHQYPFIVFVNFMTVFIGRVCFGLPSTPVITSSCSLPVALVIWGIAPGALAWFERTSMLFTLLAIVGEYFYYSQLCGTKDE